MTLEHTVFATWLLVTLIATIVFLLVIALVIVLGETRRMRARGSDRPLTVLWLKLMVRVFGRQMPVFTNQCVGRRVLLEWDLRWGPYGQTFATIVKQASGTELWLQSEHPVDFVLSKTDRLVFRSNRVYGSFECDRCAAEGALLADRGSSQQAASATIVLTVS